MPAASPDPNDGAQGDREYEARFTYAGRDSRLARVSARHWGRHERARRAALTWAAGWALALAAVFLPVLHFVLVPLLLVGGPLLAWQRLSEASTLVAAVGECPACGAAQRIRLGGAWRQRTSVRCEGCGRAIELLLSAVPQER